MVKNEYQIYKSSLENGKEVNVLYNPANHMTVIMDYAPGRCLIFDGSTLAGMDEVADAEKFGNVKMVLATKDELITATPEEIFEATN